MHVKMFHQARLEETFLLLKNKSQKYVFEIDPNHVNPYGSTTNPEDE
jgi:hypothetical protein